VSQQAGHKPRQNPNQQRLFGGESGQQAAEGYVHLQLLLGPQGGVGSAHSIGYVQALLQGHLWDVWQLYHDPGQSSQERNLHTASHLFL
jgi:hypothetical protein